MDSPFIESKFKLKGVGSTNIDGVITPYINGRFDDATAVLIYQHCGPTVFMAPTEIEAYIEAQLTGTAPAEEKQPAKASKK